MANYNFPSSKRTAVPRTISLRARSFDRANDKIVSDVMECTPPPPSPDGYVKLACVVRDRIALFIDIPLNVNAMCAFIRIIRNVMEKIRDLYTKVPQEVKMETKKMDAEATPDHPIYWAYLYIMKGAGFPLSEEGELALERHTRQLYGDEAVTCPQEWYHPLS